MDECDFLLCADPIDLTKDTGDQDMQKALMLSMQDLQSSSGGGVLSLEEQELSRSVGKKRVHKVHNDLLPSPFASSTKGTIQLLSSLNIPLCLFNTYTILFYAYV